MINDGVICGSPKCLAEGNDYKTCTCPEDRQIRLCPSSPVKGWIYVREARIFFKTPTVYRELERQQAYLSFNK